MKDKPKTGRPAKWSKPREELTKITFKADSATVDDIKILEDAVTGAIGSGQVRSQAIRQAIHEVAERLRAGGVK